MMSLKPGLYYDYKQELVLEYLKSGKGNLNDYQRHFYPHLNSDSIYAWMGCQDMEFRIQCRIYRNPSKKPAQVEKFEQDFIRLKLIRDQKIWRQKIDSLVTLELPKGLETT